MLSNHLILGHPLLLLSSIFSSIRVFSSESALHIRWPKYWSFSFSISPSNEYSGLISFRIDWFDLAVWGTFKSLFQHHNPKALILRESPKRFLICVHLSLICSGSHFFYICLENHSKKSYGYYCPSWEHQTPGTTERSSKSSNFSWTWKGPNHIGRPGEKMGKIFSPTPCHSFHLNLPVHLSWLDKEHFIRVCY